MSTAEARAGSADEAAPRPTGEARPLLQAAGWFFVYLAVTVWLTWPLVTELDRVLPCTNLACTVDTLYSAWAMSWQSHALATAGVSAADANIFYPTPDALYYGPAGFGAVPYFAPIYLATGSAAVATNLFLIISVGLSATAMHWVVQRWTGLAGAGVIAASMLLLHPWYLWGFVATTTHLSPLQYFPFIVWLAASPLASWTRAVVLAGLIAAQCLSDLVYVAPAVIAPLVLIAASRVLRPRWRRSGLALLAVVAGALLAVLPFTAGYLRVRGANPAITGQTLWNGRLDDAPSDLASLLWRSSLPTTIAPAALTLILAGALLALRRRREVRSSLDPAWTHGAAWVLAGAVLSLRPLGQWGDRLVDLPNALLAMATPFYEIVRVPERLGVATFVGAGVLAGAAYAEVAGAIGRRSARAGRAVLLRRLLAGAVVLALYAVMPPGTRPLPSRFPVQRVPATPPRLVEEMRRGAGPFVQLPVLATRRGFLNGRANAAAMYRSTFHWRPMLNGSRATGRRASWSG
jgi:MYXO-CTERM domain-containing protein